MKLTIVSIALCLLALCAFGQTNQQGSIFEWHGVKKLSVMQQLPVFMYSVQKTDLLEAYIYTERNDVNQFNVTASYEVDGVRMSQYQCVPKMIPGFTIVVFSVPQNISKIRISVKAGLFNEVETAVFE